MLKVFLSITVLSCSQYNPDPSKVVGVFGLSLYTGERDLREMFEKYGPIKNLNVVYDHQVMSITELK